MTNREAAHAFFYSEGGFYNRRTPEAFCDDRFFSYSTCIAKKAKTKDGRRILLLSKDKFSSTTSKHITALKDACYWNIIEIPQRIDRTDFIVDEVLETLYNDLKYAAAESLSLKRNREEFNYNYETLRSLVDVEGFHINKTILRQFKTTYERINNPEQLAKLKAKERAAEKRKQQRLQAQLKRYICTYDIAELAKMAYSREKLEQKEAIKKYINPRSEYSFAWFDGELVKTSQGITVNRQEVEKLLQLWQRGKIQTGMKVSIYEILEINNSYIKIGCHKIPLENIQALINQTAKTQMAA